MRTWYTPGTNVRAPSTNTGHVRSAYYARSAMHIQYMYCSFRICWTNISFEKEAAQERLLKCTARKCAAVGLQSRPVAALLCTSDGMMTPASSREPTTSSAVPSRKRNTARATERHGNLRGGRSNCANEQVATYEHLHVHLDMIYIIRVLYYLCTVHYIDTLLSCSVTYLSCNIIY